MRSGLLQRVLAIAQHSRPHSHAPNSAGFLGPSSRTFSQTSPAHQESNSGAPPRGKLPFVIQTKGVPVHLYAHPDEVENDAIKQLIGIAESPLPVAYVSAMPDVHLGKGVTIGSVFASEKYVCPNAVGVDIGCGMCAVLVKDLTKHDVTRQQLERMQKMLKMRVPVGFNQHRTPLPGAKHALEEISQLKPPTKRLESVFRKNPKIANQLGTLGGGNHFLEVVYDELDRVWVMLHSGSRNVGNTSAQFHDEVAKNLLRSKGLRAQIPGLNYMEIESREGQEYLKDMEWCQGYAMRNRAFMRDIMVEVVNEVTGKDPDMEHAINIHHNYCNCERCTYTDPRTGETVDKKLWVTRKGATSALDGQYGIIPGSMGTGSYITKGKGEAKAWSSCSHGAGRRMSRTKAFKAVPQGEFETAMAGIVCDTHPKVKDEAPQAYKDLQTVMENQTDMVDVVHRLKPLLNVKGF
ncbi:hypothetical protein BSKO_08008 [Bryopsis sp. KO-2023]|nr:hypothetical protein BSKO_08008 [Bryopsis sp. KO-2023]